MLPMSEPFLSNQRVIARYLPEDWSIQSFDFDSCSEPNCNDFTPEGNIIVYIAYVNKKKQLALQVNSRI